MHEYSSNKSYRKTVIITITVISLAVNALIAPYCNVLIDLLLKYGGEKLYPLIVLFGVGFSAVFGALYALFDNVLWKILPVFKRQNISGEYICTGKSSYQGFIWKADIIIKQTWSRILVSLKTETSSSKSFMAKITVGDDGIVNLHYCFNNIPNGMQKGLRKHEGTARLNFEPESKDKGEVITGIYFNYPEDRPKHGTMRLEKKQKNKKGRK
ncbi:MAG: hypothetical protein NC033_04120 [Clostridiales bacterium]|nr:hypothetical protein [Clostridiales bacterium]